jgi:hypothetical protein
LVSFGALLTALMLLTAPAVGFAPRANPSVRDSTINGGASVSGPPYEITVAEPSGVTTGDLVLVFLSVNGTSITHSDANGATAFDNEAYETVYAGGLSTSIWSRWWQSGDPSTYTFELSDNQRFGIAAMAIENVHAAMFDAAIVQGENGGATDCDANSITTATANALHIAVMGLDGNTTTIGGFPSGYTVHESGGNQNITVTSKIIASPGATGAQNFNTFSASQGCSGWSLALRSEDASDVPFAIFNSLVGN